MKKIEIEVYSVEEKLPTTYDTFNVYSEPSEAWFQGFYHQEAQKWHDGVESFYSEGFITHWCELPKL